MTVPVLTRPPAPDEYAPFYHGYVTAVPDGDVLATLAAQRAAALARRDPAGRAGHRYAEGKWSVREVLGHLADVERIFGYRALCIGRGDGTPLPGFDENAYVAAAGADARPLPELAEELDAVRRATLALYRGLTATALERAGTANGARVTVRALAYIIAGHEAHHLRILRERYGVG
ncbi:MAG TPA: DinB family protein [Gemmatimonadaceae bacterium]|nr:DinB family protein [Gemmatimonadaceae bacterium]